MDTFVLEALDLGSLYKVKIRHDNSLIGPAWFLDRVEVSDGKDKYVFRCARWLAKDKDDGKIDRTLYVKGYSGDMSSTGMLKSTRYGGSITSLDSVRTNDPFTKSPRLSGRQLASMEEDVLEGPAAMSTAGSVKTWSVPLSLTAMAGGSVQSEAVDSDKLYKKNSIYLHGRGRIGKEA